MIPGIVRFVHSRIVPYILRALKLINLIIVLHRGTVILIVKQKVILIPMFLFLNQIKLVRLVVSM